MNPPQVHPCPPSWTPLPPPSPHSSFYPQNISPSIQQACSKRLWWNWWMNEYMSRGPSQQIIQINAWTEWWQDNQITKESTRHLARVCPSMTWQANSWRPWASWQSATWDARSSDLERHWFLSFLIRWPVIRLLLLETGWLRSHWRVICPVRRAVLQAHLYKDSFPLGPLLSGPVTSG